MENKYTTGISKLYILLRKHFKEAKSDQDLATELGLSRNVIKELKTKKPTKVIFKSIVTKLKWDEKEIKDLIENDSFYEKILKGYEIDYDKIVSLFIKEKGSLLNQKAKEVYDEFLNFCLEKKYYFVDKVTFTEKVTFNTGLLSVPIRGKREVITCIFLDGESIGKFFEKTEKEKGYIGVSLDLTIGNDSNSTISIGYFNPKNQKKIFKEIIRATKLILKKSYNVRIKNDIEKQIPSLIKYRKAISIDDRLSKLKFYINK